MTETMKIRFIGDIHAEYEKYLRIVSDCDRDPNLCGSIQVGDFGIGFRPMPTMPGGFRHLFIRGNHDNPHLLGDNRCWIPDGSCWWNDTAMFVGGAFSIDRYIRVEGRDWWPEEELSIGRLNEIVDEYSRVRPDVVVTHDCPDASGVGKGIKLIPNRTRQALNAMFEAYPPKLWVFGHHHINVDVQVWATRFVGVATCDYKDIEFEVKS